MIRFRGSCLAVPDSLLMLLGDNDHSSLLHKTGRTEVEVVCSITSKLTKQARKNHDEAGPEVHVYRLDV